MLPDFGISEMIVVAVVALIVVGPKDLPIMMRKLGQFLARMRNIASEFRSSFDEMARQSELDELRREVEALRTGKMRFDPDEAMRAEITDVYSQVDDAVASGQVQLHPPMSYQYSEEAMGLAPAAQAAASGTEDVYALSPAAQSLPEAPSAAPAPAVAPPGGTGA